MNSGKTLFAQVMEFVPWTSFARIVARYSGDARVTTLPCTEHFRIMAYAQLTWRESLRDIEATLSANAVAMDTVGIIHADRLYVKLHLVLSKFNDMASINNFLYIP